ncbi:phospholipid ABC transporter ATP-binding protein MlaF, partial [Salmonella enterica subsp. enterica serovar Schwarzengrund]|nr:phospholipid ABC transporter ATP-binding protein MlaF [Salmonella enterica subsp. enterica serovar Schwarzengrund]EBX5145138.1 phospholipid ABC transporter ATP-binding protein MlaF [Salmonella enterica subsp. enterica serovar Newport]
MNRQTENIIEIRNMCFRRGSRMLFNDISLDVPRGKVTAIMGPSGIG